ncbi:P2X purinoceptor 7-like [Ixodes scapularis]|uniref:P2X purinoceptor 7-like n=1 Tax=Ixodes scapularis TaxID=6945 RepID=UPI001AD7A7FE|nr:P2X purinoceptor 7-like [Ixodes scapularis]
MPDRLALFELQRRLIERSRLLSFVPYADTPFQGLRDRSSSDGDTDSEDGASSEQQGACGSTRARSSPDHQPPEPGRLGCTNWCICGRCEAMPTIMESVCCREIPAATEKQQSGCVTRNVRFHTLCMEEVVLDIIFHTLQDHGVRVESTRRYRYISYSQLAHWLWGRLGRNHRTVLPACAVHKIRERFPSEDYTGFQYANRN